MRAFSAGNAWQTAFSPNYPLKTDGQYLKEDVKAGTMHMWGRKSSIEAQG
jgi:hypothetical protein